MLVELAGTRPVVPSGCFVAPTAVLAGDVALGPQASVWYGAVLRGDAAGIRVGARTNVQDNAVLHAAPGAPTIVGDDVLVGHGAILESCVVASGATVGMGAVVLAGATVGAHAVVAAGAVVREGQHVPPRTLVAGVPVTVRRRISEDDIARSVASVAEYLRLAELHLAASYSCVTKTADAAEPADSVRRSSSKRKVS